MLFIISLYIPTYNLPSLKERTRMLSFFTAISSLQSGQTTCKDITNAKFREKKSNKIAIVFTNGSQKVFGFISLQQQCNERNWDPSKHKSKISQNTGAMLAWNYCIWRSMLAAWRELAAATRERLKTTSWRTLSTCHVTTADFTSHPKKASLNKHCHQGSLLNTSRNCEDVITQFQRRKRNNQTIPPHTILWRIIQSVEL